jgi:4-diphosphocytidyl-2-C-methyl-D-erythritol kinase
MAFASMSFHVERAVASQIQAICAIERTAVQMFRDHPAWPFYAALSIPPEMLQEAIQRGLVWVAKVAEHDDPVGFVWLDTEHGGDVIGIAEIDVLPVYHKRGIGAALLERACEWARSAGYRRVDLGTLADVPWNAPFYAKHGFVAVDKRDARFAYARDRDRENGFPDALRVFMSRELSATEAGEWTVWPAPAKLNLFLRKVGEYEDGHHEWQTVVRLLDWSDELRVRVRDDDQLCHLTPDVEKEHDVILRAAALLRAHAGISAGADIEIESRIPRHIGLGNESSIAATVLVALNHLWNCGLDVNALAEIGKALGNDVPVFVRGRSAWVTGAGDRSKSITLPKRWYVVLDTHANVSADELFQATELTRIAPPATISSFASGETLENVFEPIVRERYPRVAAALDWLDGHGHARLSGSSGCVFLETTTPERAEAVVRRVPAEFTAWVAEGVGVSPLHRALSRHGVTG